MVKNIKQCIQDMNCGSDPSFKNGDDYYCTAEKSWCSEENICKTMINSGYPFYYYGEDGAPFRVQDSKKNPPQFINKLVIHKPDDPIIEHREARWDSVVDPTTGDCAAFDVWNSTRNCPDCPWGHAYLPKDIDKLNKVLENSITCDEIAYTDNNKKQPANSIELHQAWPSAGAYCVNPKAAPLIPKNCYLYKQHPLCYVDPAKGAVDDNIGKCSLVPDAFLPPHAGPKGGLNWACLPDLSHCDCSDEECIKNHPFIFNEKACKPGTRPHSTKCSREICAKDQCDNNNPYLCLDGAAKGGCRSTPWDEDPNCSSSCNTSFCRHAGEQSLCNANVCGWQTCDPTNPHLCLDGPAKGGCSSTPWESIPDCYSSCDTSNC